MSAAQITALPTAPDRRSPAEFSAHSDAYLLALETVFVPEINALSTQVNEESTIAAAAAITAAAAAAAATAASGVSIWVSGTTYAIGDCRFSPIDFATYRRKTSGAGTADPSADTTNWTPLIPVYVEPISTKFSLINAISSMGGL
ncbi:MAG: hypothetical protein WCP20_10935 [Desulfuromonadales bacterium]